MFDTQTVTFWLPVLSSFNQNHEQHYAFPTLRKLSQIRGRYITLLCVIMIPFCLPLHTDIINWYEVGIQILSRLSCASLNVIRDNLLHKERTLTNSTSTNESHPCLCGNSKIQTIGMTHNKLPFSLFCSYLCNASFYNARNKNSTGRRCMLFWLWVSRNITNFLPFGLIIYWNAS